MSDDDFFNDDDDNDDVASTNPNSNNKRKADVSAPVEEIDPLDAFMSTLDADADTRPVSKARRSDIDERDDMEMFLDSITLAKKRAAAATSLRTDADDNVDDDDEHKRKNMKIIESLPPANHASIKYATIRKAFYTEAAEVAARPFADVERERRELHISVSGGDVKARSLKPIVKFEHLPLDRRLAESLTALGFSAPLTIQREALPVAMSGYDLIALAQTGSGKTVAYLLPMFTHILDQPPLAHDATGPIGLVLAPTHELAQQIYDVARDVLSVEVNRVSKQREALLRGLAVTGGAQMYEQKQTLKRGVEFVVATPGRMIDMIKSKACSCERISFVVLDEADRMFAMGFEQQIRSIIGQVRPDRQVLLFSATFKKRLEELAADVLVRPVRISVGNKGGQANERIVQIVEVFEAPELKYAWLIRTLPRLVDDGAVLVFVSHKKDAARLADDLKRNHVRADCLHGDMPGPARKDSLERFRAKRYDVLVATDVAARGLDLPDVRTVVCFDAAGDIHAHTHRIGRTGRGDGAEALLGQAYTLLSAQDADFAALLVDSLRVAKQEVTMPLMQLASRAKRPPSAFRDNKAGGGAKPQQAYNPLMGSD